MGLFGDLQTEKDVQILNAADLLILCITVHFDSNVLLSLEKCCNVTLRFSQNRTYKYLMKVTLFKLNFI